MKKQSWRKKIIPNRKDVQQAMENVQAVHSCASCMAHLDAIRQHKEKGHRD